MISAQQLVKHCLRGVNFEEKNYMLHETHFLVKLPSESGVNFVIVENFHRFILFLLQRSFLNLHLEQVNKFCCRKASRLSAERLASTFISSNEIRKISMLSFYG